MSFQFYYYRNIGITPFSTYFFPLFFFLKPEGWWCKQVFIVGETFASLWLLLPRWHPQWTTDHIDIFLLYGLRLDLWRSTQSALSSEVLYVFRLFSTVLNISCFSSDIYRYFFSVHHCICRPHQIPNNAEFTFLFNSVQVSHAYRSVLQTIASLIYIVLN